MDVQWKNGAALITGLDFDAKLTLIDSAQCFTWREHEGKYYAVLFGGAVSLEPREEGVLIRPAREEHLEDMIHYLDLARDYGALTRKYKDYPYIVRALTLLPGLRVLNQPAWEALVCFILSSNNNVARIRRLVRLLAERFGEARAVDGLTLYALPAPDVLAEVPERALRELGFGYRAPFLVNTARRIADGFPLDGLRTMTCDDAHELLVTLSGVGDKVADCVLLFGCGHASAFPVDVWVERLMHSWFPQLDGCVSRSALRRAARELLGGDAGLVQQFMFHCARCGLIPLEGGGDA